MKTAALIVGVVTAAVALILLAGALRAESPKRVYSTTCTY